MKRILLQLCFTIILFFIISKVSGNNYDIGIYGIFVIVLIYLLFLDLKQVYQASRGIICRGFVIDFVKEDNTNDSDYIMDIKIISPVDNREYIINAKSVHFPNSKFVDIILNEENPYESTIYKKPTVYRTALFLLSILFFAYKFFSNILHM